LLRLAASQHPALWSPDLPPGHRCPGDRPTRSDTDSIRSRVAGGRRAAAPRAAPGPAP